MFRFFRQPARWKSRMAILREFPPPGVWERGRPVPQDYLSFKNGYWIPVGTKGVTTPKSFRFSVLSWNIDFMRPLGDARMESALNHLHSLVSGKADPQIIMLNEMVPSGLSQIASTDWVRRGYNMTDVTADNWQLPNYGTCMLVPQCLPIKDVFRVYYENTEMQRDALFVDVALPGDKTLRLCSTHLESLAARPPRRPEQLTTAARYLHEAHAGVLAGDLNAIEPFDLTLHVENRLKDAYLELGGEEGAKWGTTWGHMSRKSNRSKAKRLDKVLFCGDVELEGYETFGMDVQIEDEELGQCLTILADLKKPWVTDHVGVKGDFRITLSDD